jgi:hypothetical protein
MLKFAAFMDRALQAGWAALARMMLMIPHPQGHYAGSS